MLSVDYVLTVLFYGTPGQFTRTQGTVLLRRCFPHLPFLLILPLVCGSYEIYIQICVHCTVGVLFIRVSTYVLGVVLLRFVVILPLKVGKSELCFFGVWLKLFVPTTVRTAVPGTGICY